MKSLALLFLILGSFVSESVFAKKLETLEIESLIQKEIQKNASELLDATPKGVIGLCPKYKSFNRNMKLNFWSKLLGQITYVEAANSSTAVYHEGVEAGLRSSYGLLQIPKDVAERLGCEFTKTSDLRTVSRNISCGVMAMKDRVQRTNSILGKHKKDLWPSLDLSSPKGRVFNKTAKAVLKNDCGNMWAAHIKERSGRLPASVEE